MTMCTHTQTTNPNHHRLTTTPYTSVNIAEAHTVSRDRPLCPKPDFSLQS